MKKLILIFGVIVLFTSCKNESSNATSTDNTALSVSTTTQDNTGGGLKAAIYEIEALMPGGMGTTHTKVIFDDYGNKTRTTNKVSISFGGKSMNNNSNSLLVDGYIYNWAEGVNYGTKIKLDKANIDLKNTDFSKLTEDMKKKLNFKYEGTEVIDGRECRVATFSNEQMQGKIWDWKRIPIKTEVSILGKTISSKLVSLEENPSIPAGTFDVPTGIDFHEMDMPETAASK